MAAKTVTLVANTATTITVSDDTNRWCVYNLSGTDTVWVSEGTAAPTIAGDGCLPVLPTGQLVFRPPAKTWGTFDIKVISSGTPQVTVFSADGEC